MFLSSCRIVLHVAYAILFVQSFVPSPVLRVLSQDFDRGFHFFHFVNQAAGGTPHSEDYQILDNWSDTLIVLTD